MSGEGFPLVKVISYFVWILGLAVILADFGYHDFLVRRRKLRWKEILERNSFLRPLHIGGTLFEAYSCGGNSDFGRTGRVYPKPLSGRTDGCGCVPAFYAVRQR